MSASIITLSDARKGLTQSADAVQAPPLSQFESYIGCLMTTSYAFAGALLAVSPEPVQELAGWVDDPALLAKLAQLPDRLRLYKFLTGYVLLAHARAQLWAEIENAVA